MSTKNSSLKFLRPRLGMLLILVAVLTFFALGPIMAFAQDSPPPTFNMAV